MKNKLLDRVVKTVNPDNSEQRVIFGVPNALNTPNNFTPTPWENYSYDANDLAPLTNPNNNVPQSHWFTPKSSLVDALGRTIQTTEHKAHYNADTEEYENVVMRYLYDIRGNLLEVRDPYNRKVFEHIYDLRPPREDENGEQQPLPPLWTRHIDSGESTVVLDVMGKVVESEDAKGAKTLNGFGVMNRPTYSWAKDTSSEAFTIRHAIIYGDDVTHGPLNPKTTNHLGQPYKNYDDSGLDTILEYDFKGNVVEAQKQVIKDSLLLDAINAGASNSWKVTPYIVDWTIAPWSEETNLLEGNYQTNVVFDALNRPTETTYPADIDNNRKVATTTYNRAGALEKITFDGTDYINHIAYNTKGDVIITAYGNGIMTRQLYDNRTFLLKRTRTSSYIQTGWIFADNANVKEDKIFSFDLMGNILQTHDKCTDCGLSATPDELTRNFAYDPLYRLLNATGRESNTQSSSVIWNDAPIAQVPNAQNSRAYTQAFQYDKLGNILKKIHTATGNSFTRRYNYQSGANKLMDIDNNQSIPTIIANFTYDTVGNQTMCQTERLYEWDYGNRLKAFYNQTGTGVEPSVYAVYLYDGGGNRTKKLVRKQGGDWESVTYIGGTFEYHKKGLEEKNYTQIANIEIRTGSFSGDVSDSVLYQMKDHLGSVGLRINHSGTTIDREEYYPFGDSSLRTFSKKRYRYCGKEKDEESGLYYYGARYYMSWACRFISIDPLAHDYMHLTPYNYAGNKPINSIDIDGMQGENEEKAPDEGIQLETVTIQAYKIPKVLGKIDNLGLGGETVGINKMPQNKDAYLSVKSYLEESPLKRDNRRDFRNVNNIAASFGEQPFMGKDVMKSVERFLTGEGGKFMDYFEAEKSLISSQIYTEMSQELNKNFKEAYLQSGEDIDAMKMSIPNPPNLGGISKQMLALFGGTQYIEVVLNSFQQYEDGSYFGRMMVNIFDIYGVSEEDIIKKYSYLANLSGVPKGLTAMWVLQNKYGYAPLINGLQIEVLISGNK